MPEPTRTQKTLSVSAFPRLRIAFITYKFGHQYGGAEAYGVELMRELSKRHDITVIAYDYDPQCELQLPFIKITISRRWPSWVRSYLFAKKTAELTAGKDYDLVHSHMNGWNAHIDVLHVKSVRYAWFSKVGLLKRGVHMLSPRRRMYRWLEQQRVHTRPPKRTIVVSPALKQQLQQAYHTPYPFDVVTPGVHPAKADPALRQATRTQLDFQDSDTVCLFVARNPQKKGLSTLLAALKPLDSNIKLLVVGVPTNELAQLNHELTGLQLQQRVRYVCQTHHIAPYYQAADLAVHPTLNDSFGMAPLEAMSHGLAVIMSNANYCGFAHYVQHEQQALLLEQPANSVELQQAIARLCADPQLQAKLRQQATKLAQQFSWPRIAQRFEAIYAEYLAAKLYT